MRDRHWKAVASECCKPVEKGPGFCLADLLALQLHKHVEGIMEIVEVAQKVLTQRPFLNFSELQVRVDGVTATPSTGPCESLRGGVATPSFYAGKQGRAKTETDREVLVCGMLRVS